MLNLCADCAHPADDHRPFTKGEIPAPPCRVEGCECMAFAPRDDYEPSDADLDDEDSALYRGLYASYDEGGS